MDTLLHEARDSLTQRAAAFDLEPAQVQMLAAAGFDAIRRNRIAEAKTIFEGLRHFRPNASSVQIGLALVQVAHGHYAQARAVLSDEKGADADSERAAFRGLIELMAGNPSGSVDLLAALTPAEQADPLATKVREAALSALSPTSPAWRRLSPAGEAP